MSSKGWGRAAKDSASEAGEAIVDWKRGDEVCFDVSVEEFQTNAKRRATRSTAGGSYQFTLYL